MILFNYSESDEGYINYIEVSGHAEYSEIGSDIVCASVSSLTTYAFNLAETFNKNIIKVVEKDNYLSIEIKKLDITIDKVLRELYNLISHLEIQFNENIKINYREFNRR